MGRGVGPRRTELAGLPPASVAGRCGLSGGISLVGMANPGLSRRDCPPPRGTKRIRRTERTMGHRKDIRMAGTEPEAVEGLRGNPGVEQGNGPVVDDSSDA